jgi:hypothetical protein
MLTQFQNPRAARLGQATPLGHRFEADAFNPDSARRELIDAQQLAVGIAVGRDAARDGTKRHQRKQ